MSGGATISPLFPLTIADTNPNTGGASIGYEGLDETSLEDMGDLINFHLKNIILSHPGERGPSFPEFGVGIKQYLFQQDLEINTEEIMESIAFQVDQYADYIQITDMTVTVNSDSNSISIQIPYFVEFQAGGNDLINTFNLTVTEFQTYDEFGVQVGPI